MIHFVLLKVGKELFLSNLLIFFLKIVFTLLLDRGEDWEKEREKETSICSCFSHAPYWGPGLQPRHVPWLGINWISRQPCGSQAGTQSTDLHQPGPLICLWFGCPPVSCTSPSFFGHVLNSQPLYSFPQFKKYFDARLCSLSLNIHIQLRNI